MTPGWKQWEVRSREVRGNPRWRIPLEYDAWTGVKHPNVPCPRQLSGVPRTFRNFDVLDVGKAIQERLGIELHDFYTDISQCVARAGTFGTRMHICRGSLIYAYGLDRVLTERELLCIQGFPAKEMLLSGVPNSQLYSGAGEAMFGISAAVMVHTLFFMRGAEWL